MAGFYLCRNDERAPERLAAARAQFARHGFGPPHEFATATHRGFHTAYIHGGPESFLRRGDDFVAVAGTLVFDGKLGTPALEALLDTFTLPFTDWSRVGGHFALLVHKAGRTALVTDFFGAFQLFHDARFDVVSTSFLAAAGSLPRLTWSGQGVYEFAFNVFPVGDDTVFDELRRLGPEVQIELGAEPVRHRIEKPLPDKVTATPLDERIERTAALLRAQADAFVSQWGERMQCPLSGGLDSRLALALLRDRGVTPHVYVYGRPGMEDVEIARAIGLAEGFEVELFQKAAWRQLGPEEYADQVERNFHETDALVTDGGLFDNGGNAFARHARQQGGQLAVSGGCGEVFRNFFYLPDRPLRARDVAQAFFARFTTADTTDEFDPSAFIAAIEAKALSALGLPADGNDPLPRPVIEQLYPRLRCRAFFGREISLVGRQGGYFMPFFDRAVIEEALTLPMDLKNLGRFEAALLTHLDPKLARHRSAYGHSFDTPPTRDHLLSEWSTRMRPVWMRRHSYALRRRLGPMTDEHGGLLSPIYLGRVLDLHFPHMQRFFRMKSVADSGLYRRIATLEYLGQHVEDRLAP
jgi:asparagine synthase (glutamine-hydrolysing)